MYLIGKSVKVKVFIAHGFKSRGHIFTPFLEAYKKDEIHFNTAVNFHNWDAGFPLMGLGFFIDLVINPQGTAEECHVQWDHALDNIEESSGELVEKINNSVSTGETALLVGHSMGVEVIRLAIEKIRSDININLLLMAGISNAGDYDDIFEMSKIKSAVNLYSENDVILNDFLPHMGGCFYMPIGTVEHESRKVMNVKLDIRHDEYSSSERVINIYTTLIRHLLKIAR